MNANEFLDKLKNVCNNERDCEHCIFFTDDSEKSMCRIANVLSDGMGIIDIRTVERSSHSKKKYCLKVIQTQKSTLRICT